MKKINITLLLFFGAAVITGLYLLNSALVIGTGYSAKYICSQVFLANRDADTVFEKDVAPINPLFNLISNKVNRRQRTVTARALKFFSKKTALYRDGCGCTLVVDATREELLDQARNIAAAEQDRSDALWPRGRTVDFTKVPAGLNRDQLQTVVARAFVEPGSATQRNTQAIVVVFKGRIVAEKYAPPFTAKTPMLGWSMSKSVTNALVGILVKQGRLDIHEPAPVEEWGDPDDPRRQITLDQLLRMSSGLDFKEAYVPFADATTMLYDSKSMAAYAAAKALRTDPDGEWYYSSGTTNIIARIVRDAVGGTLSAAHAFARRELFGRLAMPSALIEADASGSFVGSSYMFATARDWARFGLFIKNDGVVNGERILPQGWVRYSLTPTPLAPKGQYGAHFWLNAGEKGYPQNRTFPSLPVDLVYMHGFRLNMVAIVPSADLVVVRLGVTHDDSWDEAAFLMRVLECVGTT